MTHQSPENFQIPGYLAEMCRHCCAFWVLVSSCGPWSSCTVTHLYQCSLQSRFHHQVQLLLLFWELTLCCSHKPHSDSVKTTTKRCTTPLTKKSAQHWYLQTTHLSLLPRLLIGVLVGHCVVGGAWRLSMLCPPITWAVQLKWPAKCALIRTTNLQVLN